MKPNRSKSLATKIIFFLVITYIFADLILIQSRISDDSIIIIFYKLVASSIFFITIPLVILYAYLLVVKMNPIQAYEKFIEIIGEVQAEFGLMRTDKLRSFLLKKISDNIHTKKDYDNYVHRFKELESNRHSIPKDDSSQETIEKISSKFRQLKDFGMELKWYEAMNQIGFASDEFRNLMQERLKEVREKRFKEEKLLLDGNDRLENKNFVGAEQKFSQILNYNPQHFRALMGKHTLLILNGQQEEASLLRDRIKRIDTKSQKRFDFLAQLARLEFVAYHNKGDRENAKNELEFYRQKNRKGADYLEKEAQRRKPIQLGVY